MAINLALSFTLTFVGDGVSTTASFDFAHATKVGGLSGFGGFGNPGNLVTIDGGIDLGTPVGVAVISGFGGATAALSGRTVTLTFPSAPTAGQLEVGTLQATYG